jgi:hypothetical protein
MKPQCSRFLLLTTIVSSLILSSCGKKNSTSSSSSTSYFSSSNSLFSANSSFVTYYNNIKGKVSCLSGRYRLASDVNFYVNGGAYSQSTIYGTFQAGSLSSGTVSEMYVGMSVYRDLMFVTKVVNSSGTLVGYNVTLSYCSIPNSYANYPALVSNERALTNFQTPYGIVVNSSTSCGYGLVASGYYTYILSNRITGNAYTADFPVYTTFTNWGCF